MKIEVGILKSKIITDNPKLLAQLVNLYSIPVEGAFFSGAMRKGHWDGKKKFITDKGVFPSGLLERLLGDLFKIKCDPDIKRNYEQETIWENEVKGFDLKYRDYQLDAILTAINRKRLIIKGPTGSGKSFVIAGLIKTMQPRKGVILVKSKQLANQLYNFFIKSCGLKNIGICFGGNYINADVMICTIGSIEKILDTHIKESKFLIVDEVHEFANGKITVAAINSFPNAEFRFGFTATVPKNKIPLYNIEGAFGPVYEVISISDLIEKKLIAKPTINILPINYNEEEYLSYHETYDKFIVNNNFRNNKIKEIVDNIKIKQARILILVQSIEHGNKLKKLISNAYFLQGIDDLSKRYETINKFISDKNSSILIATKILQTGIDIREITHFINARGLLSEIATLQALGRSLRVTEQKTNVEIFDFLDSVKYLSRHSNKRIKSYKAEGHQVNILKEVNYVKDQG